MRMTAGRNKGFSLIEVLVVLAIFSALLGYSVINLFGSSEKSNISSAADTLISDIKLQQQNAMNGTGGTNVSHGIYFGGDRYVLFKGDTYNMSDPSNFTIELANNVLFDSVDFTDNVIVFSYGSGEVYNFDPALNSLTIKNSQSQEEKTIYLNKYGSISLP